MRGRTPTAEHIRTPYTPTDTPTHIHRHIHRMKQTIHMAYLFGEVGQCGKTLSDRRRAHVHGALSFVRAHTPACASYHTVPSSGRRQDSPPRMARHWHVDSAGDPQAILSHLVPPVRLVLHGEDRIVQAHDGVRLRAHTARHAARRIR